MYNCDTNILHLIKLICIIAKQICIIKKLMNKLDTSNSNNYKYETKHLELHILGGIKTNKLESMRITLSIQKP